jgi:SPP1 gp7 family putative phage head morphogenesis protein
MSERRLEDVVNSNLYLFNLLFRHQVYLEGVKAGMQQHFRKFLIELYGEFAKLIATSGYQQVDEFKRVELQRFIYFFQQAQARVYNQYTQQLIDLLKQFLGIDLSVISVLYAEASSKPTSQHNDSERKALVTMSSNRSLETLAPQRDQLWASFQQEVNPASGQTLGEMLVNFGKSSTTVVSQRLRAAYVNGESLKETMASIVGTKPSSLSDGLFSRFSAQNDALIATIIQQMSAVAQASIASKLYSKYQWVAILDSRTTVICRSRNGNLYDYGKGPLPPAHWFCRSKAVTLTEGDALHDIPATYYAWLRTQPRKLLEDMLGSAVAAKIVAGNPTVQDISIRDAVRPLTATQFHSKISSMVM